MREGGVRDDWSGWGLGGEGVRLLPWEDKPGKGVSGMGSVWTVQFESFDI